MLSHGHDTSSNYIFLGNIHTIATKFNAMFLMRPHKKERKKPRKEETKKGKGHLNFIFFENGGYLIYIYIFSF
jgi:hypothetical protein